MKFGCEAVPMGLYSDSSQVPLHERATGALSLPLIMRRCLYAIMP
jgi:hypothetical protein